VTWWLVVGAVCSLAVPRVVVRHWRPTPVDYQGSFWRTVEYEVVVRTAQVALSLVGMAVTIVAWPVLIPVAAVALWLAYRTAVWNEEADRQDDFYTWRNGV
jgi:hypothetical protein